MSRVSPRSTGFLLLAGLAIFYAILQWHLPHQAFWSNDGGEKLIQVKALVASHLTSPALPYDPLGLEEPGSFEFAPFLPGHGRVVGGRLLSVVPVPFPLLSTLPFALVGHGGLYLLPLLGTLLALFCLLRLAQDLGEEQTAPLVVAAAGLASPLFFYGLTFWEHSLAAGLCTAGICLLLRSRRTFPGRIPFLALAAGALMTLAAWLRGEAFILLFACGQALLCCAGYRRLLPAYALGTGGALIPSLFLNHQLYGSALTPQLPGGKSALASMTFPALLARWQDVSAYLLIGYLDLPPVNRLFLLLGLVPGLALLVLRQPSRRRDLLALCWLMLLAVVSLATLGRLFFLESPMGSSLTILGLFGSLPFLPLTLVRRDPGAPDEQKQALRFLALAALLTLAGLCLGLPARGGLQWGPRYALILIPLLVLLSVTGFTRLRMTLADATARRITAFLFLLLIGSGAGIQGFGIHLLHDKKEATLTNMAQIRGATPRVIITDTWWVPEDNGEVYNDYPFYSFYTFAKMGNLLSRLAQKGEREVLLVSAADYRDFLARQRGLTLTAFAQTHHPGLEMFNLFLHTIRLDAP